MPNEAVKESLSRKLIRLLRLGRGWRGRYGLALVKGHGSNLSGGAGRDSARRCVGGRYGLRRGAVTASQIGPGAGRGGRAAGSSRALRSSLGPRGSLGPTREPGLTPGFFVALTRFSSRLMVTVSKAVISLSFRGLGRLTRKSRDRPAPRGWPLPCLRAFSKYGRRGTETLRSLGGYPG